MQRATRARFVAVAGTFAALRLVPAQAQSGTTIRAGTGAVEEFALPYYAVQKGFFREAGLAVDLSIIAGGGAITQALAAGALDVAVTNSGSMSSAHVRGLPLYLLTSGSVYSANQPIAHVIVPKNSPIREAKDLSGKTVGVTTLRDMIQAAAMTWIDKHGGDAASVKWFEILSASMGPALSGGRIDAAVIVEPFYTQLAPDFTSIGLPYESLNNGRAFQTTGSIGFKPWVDGNRDLARRFGQAMLQTAAWANKNPDEVAALLAQLTKVDPAVLAKMRRVAYATKNDATLAQPVIDAEARYGFIDRAFPAAELIAPGV